MSDAQRPAKKVHLLGLPSDHNSSFLRGAAQGPSAIRAALSCASTNWATESGLELSPGENIEDLGDVPGLHQSFDHDRIVAAVTEALSSGCGLIGLGGDHAVSFPAIRAVAGVHGALDIVHVDAHPDLYPNFEDNPDSHASPMARVLEAGLCGRLVQVGIRTLNATQREMVDRHGVEVIPFARIERLAETTFSRPVYVSIDLDGLDPAFAPGVSHPEPGGLSTRQVVDLIQRLPGRIVAGDVVELNPDRDFNDLTARVGAKLVKELAARILGVKPLAGGVSGDLF